MRQTTLPIGSGTTVCFFTDGLVEARVNQDIYGVDRLEAAVAGLGEEGSAQDLVDRVARETTEFADDIAVCVVRPQTTSAAAALRVEEIEVTPAELASSRLPRLLTACGLDRADVGAVLAAVEPHVEEAGSCVLRVRITDAAVGFDVAPESAPAALAAVRAMPFAAVTSA
jgi:hypothetical protein